MGERIEIEIDSTRILLSRGLYVSEITGAKTRAILIEMLAAGLGPVPLERMALVSDCTTDRKPAPGRVRLLLPPDGMRHSRRRPA